MLRLISVALCPWSIFVKLHYVHDYNTNSWLRRCH